MANYDNQPLKYSIADVAKDRYVFEPTTIDTNDVTTSYVLKLIFDKKILGGLKPFIGYGIEKYDRTDNVTGGSIAILNQTKA